MVAYGRDGLLYVGMGDGGSGGDPENRAQNPDSLLGKILRLDPAHPGARPVIVADGVRNPWRFSFDRKNGDLWIGDVGQDSIEEVDHVAWPLGGLLNFGWNVYEGTSTFKAGALGPGRLVKPVAQYSHAHGCSITGGYVYRGTAVPAAAGRYFYGDYCSGTVWSLKLVGGRRPPDPAGAVQGREPDVVRPGRGGRALCRLRGGHDLPPRLVASGAPRPASPREHADRDPDRVDHDVVPGRVATADEVLVDLVGGRVERSEQDRDRGTLEGADEERAEHRVLRQVRELAEHEIPRAEPGAEARDRREREDHGRPEHDGRPRPEGCSRHRPMIGFAAHKGAR